MLAIVDTVCHRPYARQSLDGGALGGTEATVIRIAEGLDAHVFQHNRLVEDGRYRPLSDLTRPSFLIVLRDPAAALRIASQYPGVPLIVWMHDLMARRTPAAYRLSECRIALAERGATVVGVSDFHRRQIEEALRGRKTGDVSPRVLRIYNPLRPGLQPGDRRDIDPDQLIYFSSPYKGLGYALWLMQIIRRRWPSMKLIVANPGYFDNFHQIDEGVIPIGAVAQSVILGHVSRSLCTFAPNFEYPETFGLVLAESNAVGTPVLGHAIGAASEVCADPQQIFRAPWLASRAFMTCQSLGRGHARASRILDRAGAFDPYLDRLARWRDGERPQPTTRREFELPEVLRQWQTTLGQCG